MNRYQLALERLWEHARAEGLADRNDYANALFEAVGKIRVLDRGAEVSVIGDGHALGSGQGNEIIRQGERGG